MRERRKEVHSFKDDGYDGDSYDMGILGRNLRKSDQIGKELKTFTLCIFFFVCFWWYMIIPFGMKFNINIFGGWVSCVCISGTAAYGHRARNPFPGWLAFLISILLFIFTLFSYMDDVHHARKYSLLHTPKTYRVHDYWALDNPTATSVKDLLIQRAARIHEQFPDRDDFLVEKSKCYMYTFFEKNRINHGKIIERIINPSYFWDTIKKFKKYPVVVKFCHLTQGSQAGSGDGILGNTFFLKNAGKAETKSFKRWINEGFATIAADPHRPWTKYMEAPLASIQAGILLQEAWPIFPGHDRPLEVKISVIWGRAYFCRFEGALGGVSRVHALPLESFEPFDAYHWPFRERKPFPDIPNIALHVKHAVELAERDAAILKMEFVRVDIFLNPKDYMNPGINEHSIFELDKFVGSHGKYISQLWTKPYTLDGKIQRVAKDIKSYDLKESDTR